MKLKKIAPLMLCVAALMLSACSETQYAAHVAKHIPMPQDAQARSVGTFKVGNAYNIQGKRYNPTETYNMTEVGLASWYGPGFNGKKTANGEIFDKDELTAAHRTIQLPSICKVTNLENGRSIIVRVNDRGPFAKERIMDLSERAATLLGYKNKGTAKIKIEVLADASREVASIAKTGRSTKGYEIAYNENNGQALSSVPVPSAKPQMATTQVAINNAPVYATTDTMQVANVASVQIEPLDDVIQGVSNPAIRNVPLTGNVFVQAGSFSQEANALQYRDQMEKWAPSRVYMTRVNNQSFYRVRLGPFENEMQARQIMAALNEGGNQQAVIVAE